MGTRGRILSPVPAAWIEPQENVDGGGTAWGSQKHGALAIQDRPGPRLGTAVVVPDARGLGEDSVRCGPWGERLRNGRHEGGRGCRRRVRGRGDGGERLPVVPWHPAGRGRRHVLRVTLQLGQIIERIGPTEFTRVTQAQVYVRDVRPFLGLVEERVLRLWKAFHNRNYVKFRIMLSWHPAAACFRGTSGIGSSHNHRSSRNCMSGFAAARRDRGKRGDSRDANAFFFDSRSACRY